MRTLCALCLMFKLPAFVAAQTNVDKLVKTLDSLSLSGFNDWKVSPDLKAFKPDGDPTRPGFNDSVSVMLPKPPKRVLLYRNHSMVFWNLHQSHAMMCLGG